MSGLAGLLVGHVPMGAYRWHAAFPPDDVRRAVEHADWRFGYVDGWVAQTKRELLTALGEALQFPDYYGRNLDALRDCLRDLDGPGVLLWDGWATLARSDEHTFGVVLGLLGATSDRLAVLLRGEGPDLELPSLD
jgi:RNAse (barnase) inhibitor barstar